MTAPEQHPSCPVCNYVPQSWRNPQPRVPRIVTWRGQERPETVPGSPAPSEGAIGALIRSITTPTAYWSEWPDSTFETPTETGETA